ncbi:Zinc/iron permease, fungal/plant [Pleurostoma richardsiae]|uniref:Zinc/iron permease, fungal/plant n=1 Tax=Pleurostoma richardsiae TaxID=41990 RepID=A0AA38RSG7_9PEZI|nr:Zinc/iron permease, fungal/plant [Pleurostoma richardsiae]
MDPPFNPHSVDLEVADQRDIICFLASLEKDNEGGSLGIRISSVFVIFLASTATTLFPVLATRVDRICIPLYLYLFFRYFGSGVIIATAFIHLLDPAYEEIGPASCVGLTGGWATYTWPPAIAMASALLIFLLEFVARWVVENKQGLNVDGELGTVVGSGERASGSEEPSEDNACNKGGATATSQQPAAIANGNQEPIRKRSLEELESLSSDSLATRRAFKEKIAAFLILEFGIIFHSVIIGLNLGVVGDEFTTLYPVMVFHQSFEGLGIGARLSEIPFPKNLSWLPWLLSLAYGLTTPIAIAAGLGLRTSYDSGSFTANVVSGVIDAASAGILLYTGLVEMLARDFLFTNQVATHKTRVVFMIFCLFLGAALMSLLGKWA